MKQGHVHLVGAGPGDPELLTLKAARLIASADVVVHDRLVHPAILRLARAGARLIFAGKEGGGHHVDQASINATLIAEARGGHDVVRLKGGDPFVFGRGGEEALALRLASVPFDVVPGVTSGLAAAAYAGIPVTHRGLATAVTFATATTATGARDWRRLADSETLVLFMCGRRLAQSTQALIAAGRDRETPCAVVEAGSWERQRAVEGTLATIAARAARIGSPALLVVGEVVRLRERLGGFLARPEVERLIAPRAPEAKPAHRRTRHRRLA
ncbi:MAG: uroporphyrinogen-III C-methyltransferase [Deltaproteobacteria bacterium]